MKKLSLKSLILPSELSMVIILLALVSCKSLEPTTLHHTTQSYTTLHNVVDTIYRYDSIFIREALKGDTLYLTRIEYRDRWHVQMIHDTILDTQIVEKVIEHPPQRYVPKFYKWCTIFWFASLTLMVTRWWLKRRV